MEELYLKLGTSGKVELGERERWDGRPGGEDVLGVDVEGAALEADAGALVALAGIELPGFEVGAREEPGRSLVRHLIDEPGPGRGGQRPAVDAQAVEEDAPDLVLRFDGLVRGADGRLSRVPVQAVEALQDAALLLLDRLPDAVALVHQPSLDLVDVEHLKAAALVGPRRRRRRRRQTPAEAVDPDQHRVLDVLRPARVQKVAQVGLQRVPVLHKSTTPKTIGSM